MHNMRIGNRTQNKFRVYLWVFSGIFSLLLVALEVLDFVSRRNNGIMSVKQNMQYLWTYGPTFGTHIYIYI